MTFTDDEREAYKEAFSMFDADGSGTISTDELGAVFKKLGNEVSSKELKEMILEVDEDGSGEIDFGEFLTMMERQKNAPKGSSKSKGLDMLHQAVAESMVTVQVKKLTKELALQRRRMLDLEEQCDTLAATTVSKDGLSMILDARCPPLSKKQRRNAKTDLEATADLESVAKQINFVTTLYREFVKETKEKDEKKDKQMHALEKRIKSLENTNKKLKKKKKGQGSDDSSMMESVQQLTIKFDILQKTVSKLSFKINKLNVQFTEISDNNLGFSGDSRVVEGIDDLNGAEKTSHELEELEYFKNSPIHSPNGSKDIDSMISDSRSRKGSTDIVPVSDWNGNVPSAMGESMRLLQVEQSKKMDSMMKERAIEDKRNRERLKNFSKELKQAMITLRKHGNEIIKLKGSMQEMRREIEDTKRNISKKALELYYNRVDFSLKQVDKLNNNDEDTRSNGYSISPAKAALEISNFKREIGIIRQSLMLLASPDISPILCACHKDHVKQVQELDRMRGQVKALGEELTREQHVHRLSKIHHETETRIRSAMHSRPSTQASEIGTSRIGSREGLQSRSSDLSLLRYSTTMSPLSADFQRNTLSRLSAVRSLNSRGSLGSRGSLANHTQNNEKSKRIIGTIFAENKRVDPVPIVGALKVSPRFEYSSQTVTYPNINVLAPIDLPGGK
eukprot:g236.t1